MLRLPTVGAAKHAHADSHEAAVGFIDQRATERRLCEAMQSLGLRDPFDAAPRPRHRHMDWRTRASAADPCSRRSQKR